jgi:hypothetical protein
MGVDVRVASFHVDDVEVHFTPDIITNEREALIEAMGFYGVLNEDQEAIVNRFFANRKER